MKIFYVSFLIANLPKEASVCCQRCYPGMLMTCKSLFFAESQGTRLEMVCYPDHRPEAGEGVYKAI